ncbi:MAG: MFS transporter [Oscillospiraceae bacterium]|nr:MFS transporter [Oscillospiraceae bacterium]
MENSKAHTSLKRTLLLISIINMPTLALSPATQQISEHFSKPLASVQTAISTINFVQIGVALLLMILINRGIATKKKAVIFGQCFYGLTALFAVLFHKSYPSVWCLSVLTGCASGSFVTNSFGLMFDNFGDEERRGMAGYQTSFINLGGILMSLAGGLLAAYMWYGGYLVFSIGIVFAIICAFTLPSYKTPAKAQGEKRTKIRGKVFYYAALTMLFMIIYSSCGANISTHLSGHFENYSKYAGICSSVQMAGGAVMGFVFPKLSAKLKDYIMALACLLLFSGMLLLSFCASSLPFAMLAMFVCGGSMSLFMPFATYGVSQYSDPGNSSITSFIISSIAPSAGGFLSPLIITNITNAIRSGSTVFRYRFTAASALAVGAAIFAITLLTAQKKKA